MHALGVIHGSVSPQCVLLEGKDRTARAYLVDVRRTSSGPAYHSPERSSGAGLSQADDTWALACTLYVALTGGPPFAGSNDSETKQKILTSAPAPLAVFDVGDDDLQRVLDDSFSRELGQRTTSVSTLRKALEEWHPDPNVGGLPGLDDEDTEGGGDDEDEEDERTIMRTAPVTLAELSSIGSAPAAGAPPPRPPLPSAGGGAALSPFASPRTGPAARAPAPPAPLPSSPFGSAAGPSGPRAPSPGGFPPPAGPPPDLGAPSPGGFDDDDEEDEKTMMRGGSEALEAALSAHGVGPSRSGAFPAAPPTGLGAFPAPVRSLHDDEDAGDEATRMMQAPVFPDDDEQATIMRSSASSEEVERITASMNAADAARGAHARVMVEPPGGLGSTVAFDAMGFAPPPDAASRAGMHGFAHDPAAPAGSHAGAPHATPEFSSGTFPAPLTFGTPPLAPPAFAQAPTSLALAPRKSNRAALWIAIVFLLLAALATFAVLRMR